MIEREGKRCNISCLRSRLVFSLHLRRRFSRRNSIRSFVALLNSPLSQQRVVAIGSDNYSASYIFADSSVDILQVEITKGQARSRFE
jgi:hypothetical protein